MDWSDYLAIGGAVGGVAGFANLGWKIFEWRLRQARIKVEVAEGCMLDFNNTLLEVVIVTIMNRGKEAIKMSSVGFKCKERQNMIIMPKPPYSEPLKLPKILGEALPYELKGNDSYKAYIRKDVLLSNPVEVPLIAWCRDAIDNVYCSKKYKIMLSR